MIKEGEIINKDIHQQFKKLIDRMNKNGSGIEIDKMDQVYFINNRRLMKSFEIYRKNIEKKHQNSPFLFKKDDWRIYKNQQDYLQRKRYIHHLSQIINDYRDLWNDGSRVF